MKTILFIEPLFYGVNLLKEARELGCRVVPVISHEHNPAAYGYQEYYDDFIVADTSSADAVINAITSSKYRQTFDAVIPAADYVTEIAAKVSEQLHIRGTSVFAARAARNKGIAQDLYEHHHVPCARYRIAGDLEEAVNAAAEIGYPVVLKPLNACGSQNVSFIRDEAELKHVFQEITSFNESYLGYKIADRYLLEEYMSGPEFSVEIFLKDSNVLFSEVTEKKVSPLPYFVETMHVFPMSNFPEKRQEILDTARKAVMALGFSNGVLHAEVKLTSQGAKIVEVNGRPGGDHITSDLVVNAKGINLYKELVKWYIGEDVHLAPKKDLASAIGYVLPEKPGNIIDIANFDTLKRNKKVTEAGLELPLPVQVEKAHDSDGRIAFVIVTDRNPSAAKNTLTKLLDNIQLVYGE